MTRVVITSHNEVTIFSELWDDVVRKGVEVLPPCHITFPTPSVNDRHLVCGAVRQVKYNAARIDCSSSDLVSELTDQKSREHATSTITGGIESFRVCAQLLLCTRE